MHDIRFRDRPFSDVDPLPPHVAVIQIRLRDRKMGKNCPAEIALRADIKETLRVLTPLIAELGGAAHSQLAEERIAGLAGHNWTAHRKARAEIALAKAAAADRPRVADAHYHRPAAEGRHHR